MTLEILSPSKNEKYIVAPPIYRANSFEHALVYQRADQKHVEMVLGHTPSSPQERPTPPTLTIATFRTVNNPNMVPSALIELSMEEARLLRNFLLRQEVRDYLDGE